MSRFIHSSDPKFFENQQRAWSAPPVDGVGYIPSAELLNKRDWELRTIIETMEKERYNVNGWRNHKNWWREKLGHESTHGKTVLDFGCGVGIEALQFAKAGNKVWIADIVPDNVALAMRVLEAFSYTPSMATILDSGLPMVASIYGGRQGFDIFYCSGVLHHIPNARAVLLDAVKSLNPDGEIRLMLYSDIGWKISTESPVPPVEEDVETNPLFKKFTGTFDSVGAYADWYSADKLLYRFGDFLKLVSYDYICSDGAYCVAILKVK